MVFHYVAHMDEDNSWYNLPSAFLALCPYLLLQDNLWDLPLQTYPALFSSTFKNVSSGLVFLWSGSIIESCLLILVLNTHHSEQHCIRLGVAIIYAKVTYKLNGEVYFISFIANALHVTRGQATMAHRPNVVYHLFFFNKVLLEQSYTIYLCIIYVCFNNTNV